MHGYLARPRNAFAVRNVHIFRKRAWLASILWVIAFQALIFYFIPDGMGGVYEGWMLILSVVSPLCAVFVTYLMFKAWRVVRSHVNAREAAYVTWSTIREFKQALKESDTRPNGKFMIEELLRCQMTFDDGDKLTRNTWRGEFVPRYARRPRTTTS